MKKLNSNIILIIAYGNTLRGDDGAGITLGLMLEAACLARQIPAKRLSCHQLIPELVVDMVSPDVSAVVFVDTRIVAPQSPRLLVEAETLTPSLSAIASTGHSLGPDLLLVYAKSLYNRDILARQLTVPGVTFSHGEILSQTTSHALEKAQPLLDDLIDQLSQPFVHIRSER